MTSPDLKGGISAVEQIGNSKIREMARTVGELYHTADEFRGAAVTDVENAARYFAQIEYYLKPFMMVDIEHDAATQGDEIEFWDDLTYRARYAIPKIKGILESLRLIIARDEKSKEIFGNRLQKAELAWEAMKGISRACGFSDETSEAGTGDMPSPSRYQLRTSDEDKQRASEWGMVV
ncbi:MAG: hypothetical protein WA057_03695 [Candidatus Magasanikiibacteriota bacterium]